jgi:transposase
MSSAENSGRHPGGRPSKYQPAYVEEVVNFCEQGYSLTAFAGEIGVDRASITRWMEEHEEFRVACNRAKAKRARWWEDRAKQVAAEGGPGGQATMVIFGLKNHAPEDFSDKQQLDVNGKLTLEQLVTASYEKPKTDTGG